MNEFRGLDWDEKRWIVLERDNHTCQFCGKTEQEDRIDVHHIIPYRKSKSNHETNMICLCKKCHVREDNFYRQFNIPSLTLKAVMRKKYLGWAAI